MGRKWVRTEDEVQAEKHKRGQKPRSRRLVNRDQMYISNLTDLCGDLRQHGFFHLAFDFCHQIGIVIE